MSESAKVTKLYRDRDRAERDMRRAFNRWDKARSAVSRWERRADAADMERAREYSQRVPGDSCPGQEDTPCVD